MKKLPIIYAVQIREKYFLKNDRYGINQQTVICKKCGLVYSSPRLTTESVRIFYESDDYRKIYEEKSLINKFEMKYSNAINYTYNPSNLDNFRDLTFIDFL